METPRTTPDELADLARRLDLLHLESRLWKGGALAASALLTIVLGIRAAGERCEGTCDLRSVQLCDGEDRVRLRFGPDAAGGVALALLDPAGLRTAALESMADGTARFEISRQGRGHVLWDVSPGSISSLHLLNPDYAAGGSFSRDEQERSGFFVNRQGNSPLRWEATPEEPARLTDAD